ncbi:MAG: hypothetical protein OJJ54_17855 [Pseudonocardia sp.]|nr:hypothetical protein [Pseudonocardia sp.]
MPTSLDTYAPFDSGPGSNVTEATWRDFMRHMLGSASGVLRGFLNEFSVIGDNSGMNVKVDTGECWMRGHYGKSTAQKTLSIATAHATLARKDRVILRADFTNNRVEVDVLTGTAASSPIVPAVTQSTTIWETSLAIVDIPAADTAIGSSQVTDDRVYTTAQGKYRRSTNQSIPTGVFTAVVLDTVVSRSGDLQINPSTGVVTLLRSGLWSISASMRFADIGGGKAEMLVSDPANVSGGTTSDILAAQTMPFVTGNEIHGSCSSHERLPAGKQLALFAYQNSGSAKNVIPAANGTSLSLVWVGP